MATSRRDVMIFRAMAAVIALLCTSLVIRNIPAFVAAPSEYVLFLLIIVPAGTAAAFGWWFAIAGDSEEVRAVVAGSIITGAVVGAVAFFAGFLGPIFLSPSSNQGPLLGFIIGPAGFVVGAIAGATIARRRQLSRR